MLPPLAFPTEKKLNLFLDKQKHRFKMLFELTCLLSVLVPGGRGCVAHRIRNLRKKRDGVTRIFMLGSLKSVIAKENRLCTSYLGSAWVKTIK